MLKRNIAHAKILHGLERCRSNLTKTITAHMNAENMNHESWPAKVVPLQVGSSTNKETLSFTGVDVHLGGFPKPS